MKPYDKLFRSRAAWWLALPCALLLCASAAAETIHILPLGDSITQGGKTDREEYTYRYPLFKMLMEAGVDFDFIGSLDAGLQPGAAWPEKEIEGRRFDPDHEGHYGWKTARVLEMLPTWSQAWDAPPDIALVHLGTNDQKAEDYDAAIVEPLKGIVAFLRARNPRVVVLIGHLNFNGGAALEIRPRVEAMAQALSTEASPVITVPHYRGWQEEPGQPDSDTFDWVHPNPQGQQKMAENWFEAMRPYLFGTGGAAAAAAPARNLILFIGDGMGPEQVHAARCFAGMPLFFESFPVRSDMVTAPKNAEVTDSAASATAIATGRKVNNGVLSMALPGDGSELETLLERFQARGKRVGLVTTTYITHATPAGFGAHEPKRGNLAEIAADLLGQTRPNVLLGGGGNGMSPEAAREAGYTVVTDRAGLKALDLSSETYVSGQFGDSNLPFEYDGTGALPGLAEMTAAALDLLEEDPDGFFLMVEGGRIDHAGHANDLIRNLHETLGFDQAVRTAVAWAKDREDTLVVVTADHETGGLQVVKDLGPGREPEVTWSTKGHTPMKVPVYAWGCGAQRFETVDDNTEVHDAFLDVGGAR